MKKTLLKRSGFRKKTLNEVIAKQANKKSATGLVVRHKAIKKPKKKPINRLNKKLWELCKQIIRLKYGNVCYTCGKTGLAGSSWHTGHFVPSSVGGHTLRYSLTNLRPQCYRCNIDLSGYGSQFYKNLVEREGQEYVDQIFKDKQKIIKADEAWYQSKIDEYTEILLRMQETN